MKRPAATRGAMRRGAGVMLGGSDTSTITDHAPERTYFASCRMCRGFGLVTLLADAMGHDFAPMTRCGDPQRCGDKVAHPPEPAT
jgi:hypothetical protein